MDDFDFRRLCDPAARVVRDFITGRRPAAVLAEPAGPVVRGGALGARWSVGEVDGAQVRQQMWPFADPGVLGDFLSGLFALAREQVQRQRDLVLGVHGLLAGYSDDQLLAALPALRLAFTWFTPREKHHLAATLRQGWAGQARRRWRRWRWAPTRRRGRWRWRAGCSPRPRSTGCGGASRERTRMADALAAGAGRARRAGSGLRPGRGRGAAGPGAGLPV
jgi:hypothetical protein